MCCTVHRDFTSAGFSLAYNTVHTVNAKDYTKEQLDVWATGIVDLEKWNQLEQTVQGNIVTHASIFSHKLRNEKRKIILYSSKEKINPLESC